MAVALGGSCACGGSRVVSHRLIGAETGHAGCVMDDGTAGYMAGLELQVVMREELDHPYECRCAPCMWADRAVEAGKQTVRSVSDEDLGREIRRRRDRYAREGLSVTEISPKFGVWMPEIDPKERAAVSRFAELFFGLNLTEVAPHLYPEKDPPAPADEVDDDLDRIPF